MQNIPKVSFGATFAVVFWEYYLKMEPRDHFQLPNVAEVFAPPSLKSSIEKRQTFSNAQGFQKMLSVTKVVSFKTTRLLRTTGTEQLLLTPDSFRIEVTIMSSVQSQVGFVFDLAELKRKLYEWYEENWEGKILLSSQTENDLFNQSIHSTIKTYKFPEEPTPIVLAKTLAASIENNILHADRNQAIKIAIYSAEGDCVEYQP